MEYPKLIFRKMTLNDNIEQIKWMFFDNGDSLSVHTYTINLFPELKKYNLNSNKEEVYKEIEKVVTKKYNDNLNIIDDKVKLYNEIWFKYNDNYFKLLINFFNIKFPKNINIIDVQVGLLPVYPRFLDTFSFALSTDINNNKLINLCAHEILHFIWFLKWKEIYPEIPRKEYDSPYLCWQYSEIVTDPILNNEPFKNFYIFNEKSYDYFYKLKDNGELVMDKLRNIYKKNNKIEEKIKKGYNYIKKYYIKNNNK